MKRYRTATAKDIPCSKCRFGQAYPWRKGYHCSIATGGSNKRVGRNKTCDNARPKITPKPGKSTHATP
jgi:hypothetical protein